jgi:hypothetical protein
MMRFLWIFAGIVVSFIFAYFLFVLNIGLNNSYFIKRDFNKAFLARKTGDCSTFKSYIYEKSREQWGVRCIREKDENEYRPIYEFSISEITVSGDASFIQVYLRRGYENEKKYAVNYDLKRGMGEKILGFIPTTRWYITTEVRE